MVEFKITILGNGSAVPTPTQNPSAQLVTFKNQRFLIDCGEGTQMQMIRYKAKHSNLNNIFISHLHGDHYYGLIGLLNSWHLLRREKPLHIFAPNDLEKIIRYQLNTSNTSLVYPVHFHSLEGISNDVIIGNEDFSVSAFPLKHSLPVWGFLFREEGLKRKIDKAFIKKYKPDIDQISKIKNGEDYITPKGERLQNETITVAPEPARSYAYCSDTSYLESTSEYVENVGLLYHESTFDNSMEDLANKTLHSTASQAARVAKNAKAGKLLLGHYSARYKKDLERLLREAREVFPNTFLSHEGETYEI